MALQLRRLLPRGYARRAVTRALSVPPTMLQTAAPQRYSSTSFPFSPFHPCEMCGVPFRNNSARQIYSRVSSGIALQLKSSAYFTTGLLSKRSSTCTRATDCWGIALTANNIGNLRPISTASSKRLQPLIKSKSSFGYPNMRRQDRSIARSYLYKSEKQQSTIAACSTITDETSASPVNSTTNVANSKTATKRKSRKGSKKEVSAEVNEKDAPMKKKMTYFRAHKTATKATEEIDTNQENEKASTSKSKKTVDISQAKKVNNRSKSKTKDSTRPAKVEVCLKASDDGSGSDRKPLTPLYPPTVKSVVVVESVTKAKVIQKYLGDMYEVLPSYGHVRDLAGRSRSVRPDDDFSMVWEVPAAAWTHLKSIKVALKGAENLILASDPDREGEAIAWHIKEMLEQQGALRSDVTVARVVFHEITEGAIKTALMSPRYIGMNLVNAYLAHRSLDYLIGFGISPLLWRKLPGCQSAGRVQSAALALICDRETEIEKFKPQEYWTIQTDFKTPYADHSNGICIQSWIKHLNSKKLDQLSICSQEEAQAIEKRIHSSQFEVVGVKRSKIHNNPPMPYITSSLQQDAANKLQFAAGHTMKVAQKLYEGISVSSEEATGLITYIRTDGFNISDGVAEEIRSLVKERYGQEYASEDIRKYSKKVKNAQEAHEAIRPTSIRRLPSSLVRILDDDSLKLYTLIWKRTMACQMESSGTEMIQVDIGTPKGGMLFHSSASRIDFKGYQAVYEDTEASPCNDSVGDAAREDKFEVLSNLKLKDSVSPINVHLAQHFTKPPTRYSEGALIKKLEDLGIGRSSTYASVMKVLQDRNHVTMKNQVMHPEFRGRMVSAFLLHHFSEVADYSFTANMETELDNVSAGSTEWKGLMKNYWERFSKYCADARQMDVRMVEKMLEEKFGFILFPDLDSDNRICPSCSEGTLRFKVSRYGEGYFVGCDRHPKCKYIARTLSQDDDDTEPSEETQRSFPPRLLGAMPDSDEKVFLKQGPYGYYVQVGEDRKGLFPKRAPLSDVKDVGSVTIEHALDLLQYPKILGKHPDDDHPVLMTHSQVGFNVRHRRTLAPVPKNTDPKKMTLERALKLLSGNNVKKFGRPKGKSVKKEPIEWH